MLTRHQVRSAHLAATLAALGPDIDPLRVSVRAASPAIVERFYTALLSDPEAASFLSHEHVRSRLSRSLEEWLRDLIPSAGIDLAKMIERQSWIGKVHARIDLPLHLMGMGVRLIRRSLAEVVDHQGWDRDRTLRALMGMGDILDILVECVEEAYVENFGNQARAQQSLQSALGREGVAIECERLRSSLFDWERRLISALYEGRAMRAALDPAETDFALWLTHKAVLVMGPSPEIEEMGKVLAELRECYQRAREGWLLATREEQPGFVQAVHAAVNRLAFALDLLIERASLHQAARDPLTRLLGRRHIASILKQEVALSRKTGHSFACAMVDIDHFKAVNDRHGHQVGDEVLRGVADRLVSGIRSSDFAFRYGGEEFLLVFTEITPEAALARAEAIRGGISGTTIPTAGGGSPVTVSIGVAPFNGHPDYEVTIRSADAALYEAKRLGRNRVTLAPTPDTHSA
jgi:diguanylate cyclase